MKRDLDNGLKASHRHSLIRYTGYEESGPTRQEVLRSSRTAPEPLCARQQAREAAGDKVGARDDDRGEISREHRTFEGLGSSREG